MKLRTLILIVAAIAVGYKLAKSSREDAPYVVSGPRDETSGSPALRSIKGPAQWLADQATVKSLDAIRGARRALQTRMGDNDAAWN